MSEQQTIPTQTNLIEEFADIVCKYTMVPRKNAIAGGFALMSAVLGYHFYCPWLPKKSRKPNLYVICSSKAGFYRRSTIQDAFMDVYRAVMVNYLADLVDKHPNFTKNMTPEEIIEFKKKLVDDVIIHAGGSVEGVCDQISEAQILNQFNVHSTEFGPVIQAMFSDNSYQQGVGVLFSKLYYGEGGNIPLSTRGKNAKPRRVKEGLYVTMFCGMQELKSYLTNTKSITQGLARRIIWVMLEKEDLPDYKNFIREDKPQFDRELEAYIEKLSGILQKTVECKKENTSGHINIYTILSVEKAINSLDKEIYEKAKKNDITITDLVVQSMAELLSKMAMLVQIAKNDVRKSEGDQREWHTMISIESYNTAKIYLDSLIPNLVKNIRLLSEKKFQPSNISEPMDTLMELIEASKGITQSGITQKLRWKSTETKELLKQMVHEKRIVAIELDSTGGRKTTTWHINNGSRPELVGKIPLYIDLGSE